MNNRFNQNNNSCRFYSNCLRKDKCPECWENPLNKKKNKIEDVCSFFIDKLNKVMITIEEIKVVYDRYYDRYREYKEEMEKFSFIPRVLRYKKNKENFKQDLNYFYENITAFYKNHWINYTRWLDIINLAEIWLWVSLMKNTFPNPYIWAFWLVIILHGVNKKMSFERAKQDLLDEDQKLKNRRLELLDERNELEILYRKLWNYAITSAEEKRINVEEILGIGLNINEIEKDFY